MPSRMLTFLDCEAEEAKVLLYERARACLRFSNGVRAPNEPVRHDGQTQSLARDIVTVFIRKCAGWNRRETGTRVVNASPLGRTEFDFTSRRCAFQTSQGLLLFADRGFNCLALLHCFTPLPSYTAKPPKNLTTHNKFSKHGRGNRPLRYFLPCAQIPHYKSLTSIEVLNIERSASKAEIKKAYHKVNISLRKSIRP